MARSKHYVKTSNGREYIVEFPSVIENGKTDVFVYSAERYFYKTHFLKVYYRHERTWDDHMGNTPCGYYCNVPFPNGEKHRVYMFA